MGDRFCCFVTAHILPATATVTACISTIREGQVGGDMGQGKEVQMRYSPHLHQTTDQSTLLLHSYSKSHIKARTLIFLAQHIEVRLFPLGVK